jgi:hypothetical protein
VTDTNVFQLSQPGNFADPLTKVLRKGARALLAQAVEAEAATLLVGTPTRRPMMAADAWCVTAISRARDHDRHRPGGGSLPAGTRSHVRAHPFLVSERVEISQRSNLPPYPQLARREWRDDRPVEHSRKEHNTASIR